jgi:alkylation response protein AidB-like acyl-CoA dehydrogenase
MRDELAGNVAEWEHKRRIPRSVFRRLGEIGAFAVRWPDSAGAGSAGPTSSLGDIDFAVHLARESALLSLGACACVMTHADAFILALRNSGYGESAHEQAEAGVKIGCLAVSEPTGGSSPTACSTIAVRSARGWSLNGVKEYVSGFRTATDVVVFARTAAGGPASAFTMFILPARASGVIATCHETVGVRAAGTCRLRLRDVPVPDEHRVGAVGSGLGMLMRLLQLERLWAVVGAAAVSELCLDMAHAYARRRNVGGVALLERQAIAHRLADMSTQVAAIRAVTNELVDAARNDRLSHLVCAQAKLFVTRTGCGVADETLQILAGAGYADDSLVGRLWRDMRAARIAAGTDDVLRELIVRGLRPGEHSGRPEIAAVENLAAR